MGSNKHITPGRLRAYAEGRLSDSEEAAIEDHLSSCDQCCHAYDKVDVPLSDLLVDPIFGNIDSTIAIREMGDQRSVAKGIFSDSAFRFEFQEKLGEGGMGVVYRAYDRRLQRRVALKRILPDRADPVYLKRFEEEATSVAQLAHPNIVTIYDTLVYDGTPYCVFELVDGHNLNARLEADGRMTATEAAELVTVLAVAVDYAHRRDIVHRDLKPANILLRADGTPKIADFGLSKRITTKDDLGGSGSAPYMSPEQASGKDVGPATDIYALGAILYECITGRAPFRGASRSSTLEMLLTAPPKPPSSIHPGIDRDLEAVCLKCLAKTQDERYLSAGELAKDLRRFLDGIPVDARYVTRLERITRLAKRHPLVTTIVLLYVATTIPLLCGLLFTNYEKDRYIRTNSAIVSAHKLFNTRDEAARSPLSALRQLLNEDAFPISERDPTWGILAGGCQRRLGGWKVGAGCFATASGQGELIAAGTGSGTISLFQRNATKAVCSMDLHKQPITCVEFSPDSQWLATAGEDGQVFLHDVSTILEDRRFKKPHAWSAPIDGYVNAIEFSPDSQWLATGHSLQTDNEGKELTQIWRFEGQGDVTLLTKLPGHTGSVTCLAFSGDGNYVASGSTDRTVRIWKCDGWGSLPEHSLPEEVTDVQFAPRDPDVIAITTSQGAQLRRTAAPNAVTALVQNSPTQSRCLCFSENGSYLATAHDGTIDIWNGDLRPTTKRLPRPSPLVTLRLEPSAGESGQVQSIVFSGDDTFLTSDKAGNVGHWSVGPINETLLDGLHRNAIGTKERRLVTGVVQISDSQLLSGGCDGRVLISDIETGQVVQTVWPPDSPQHLLPQIDSIASSPSGRQIAWTGGNLQIAVYDEHLEEFSTMATIEDVYASRVAYIGDNLLVIRHSDLEDPMGTYEMLGGFFVDSFTLDPTKDDATELDAGILPESLSQAVSNVGMTMTDASNVQSMIPGERWRILDQDNRLFVRVTPNGLGVLAMRKAWGWPLPGADRGNGVGVFACSPETNSVVATTRSNGVWRLQLGRDSRLSTEEILETGSDRTIRCIAIAANGTRVAFGTNADRILVQDISTGTIRSWNSRALHMAFAPNSRTLLTANENSIVFWDADFTELARGRLETAGLGAFAISPDGNALFAGDSLGSLKAWKRYFEK